MIRRVVRVTALVALGWLGLTAAAVATEPATRNPEGERFFEERIRPVLVQKCFECHGPKKQQAGLRLDSREFLLKGNESGPALDTASPDESRLLAVLAYDDYDVQMPPNGKLPQSEIDAFRQWVELGAPWPVSIAGAGTTDEGSAADNASRHWAYQPVREPALPEVADAGAVLAPVDRFIQARLEAEGLSLGPLADRRTWIRRATLNLWGIPPTIEQIEAFEQDAEPGAEERLIERLLASPLYGQRWGRYWLDVARYADTKGYVFQEQIRYPFAYTYRDYVIRAFNEDLPYDRFVMEQLAADRLEGTDPASLAALGFLTVGRRFLNNTHDIIDDRIDVVTRGLMGTTVTCARCHDHKFDPIPTDDYYALYGVFASSEEPAELPLIAAPTESEAYLAYEAELKKRQSIVDAARDEAHAKILEELRGQAGDYLVYVSLQAYGLPEHAASAFEGEPRAPIVARWRAYVLQQVGKDPAIFGPLLALAKAAPDEFAARVADVVSDADSGRVPLNARVREALLGAPPKSLAELAQLYGQLLDQVHEEWQALAASTPEEQDAPSGLPDPAAEALRQIVYSDDGPLALAPDDIVRLYDRVTRNRVQGLQAKVDEWKAKSDAAPARAMVLVDRPQSADARVFIRGDARRPGKTVPRRFPQVLAGKDAPPFSDGSGRLELARAIADPANPLTARVLVNRVWMQHFGQGLVRTPSDFGTRGDAPTHPELLDWLAAQFVADGWSIKQLHRTIMLSATYRQASADRPEAGAVDPENRLLWRMPRRRLDFEAMRDSMLAAAGQLDARLDLRPVDVVNDPSCRARTVYGLVDRNDLPGMYRMFDFADPDATAGMRPQTTVPQQALFAMNAPFVIEQAQALVRSPDFAASADDDERARHLYRQVLAREPDANELELARQFVAAQPAAGEMRMGPWEQYAQVLLLTNEFLFAD